MVEPRQLRCCLHLCLWIFCR